jgi:NAD(P)-dependent dehydrogenase (short-subunit alcohol dehydrogenase family)
VRAAFAVTQRAVRRLLAEGRRGVVINVTSQMGHVGAANRSVYCASKHALEGLTKALAVELAPAGIRVVSVAPTFVDTPMTRPMFEDSGFRSEVLSSIPLGRLGAPDDVAAAVVFLAGEGASMITGTSLLVDGGWTAR